MRRSLLVVIGCLALVLGMTPIAQAAGNNAGHPARGALPASPRPAAPTDHPADPAVDPAADPTVKADAGLPAIYPTPQSVSARSDRFPLRDRAVLAIGAGTDPAALRTVRQVLQTLGVSRVDEQSDTEPIPRGVPVLIVGGADENAATADALADLGVESAAGLAADGYVLAAGRSAGRQLIVLAGTDATGTFYAAQSLRQLLVERPAGGAMMPGVEVRDWPNLPVRGVIEGFYGYPWPDAQRERQLDFYGAHKMNKYVYSPKDDPYLRAQWREPYPADQLAAIEALVQRAAANHVEFTYALSPGLSICYSSAADEQALVDKFSSLWDVGVRAFAVPLDDISYTDWNCDADEQRWGTGGAAAGHAQAYLLNQVQQNFIATHDGAQRLEMVPTEYYTVNDSPYITVLREELAAEVVVEWTGVGVVPATITAAQGAAANEVFGHDILLWDNYPVNDYAPGRLLLGPYTGREPGLGMHGITANPMVQAEASKLALFGVADYVWNDTAYDADATWQAAIDELSGGDQQARDALAAFADLEYYSILDTRQAPVLDAAVETFWTDWNAGRAAAADRLDEYLAVIQHAGNVLSDKMNNPSFVADAQPWLDAAELWGTAARAALQMLGHQRAGDGAAALADRAAALRAKKAAEAVHYEGLGGDTPVLVGDGVLDTFVIDAVSANNRWLGATGGPGTANSTMSTYQGYGVANMVDGTIDTYYWSAEAAGNGDSIGVDLGAVTDISAVEVLMGKAGSAEDYLHDAVLEYSTDGQNWTSIGSYAGQAEITEDLPEGTSARYVRLRATAAQSSWVVVREFTVTAPGREVGTVTGGPAPAEGSTLRAAADGDPDSSYTAGAAPADGDTLTLTLTLTRERPLDRVVIAGSGQAGVQVQQDGKWRSVGDLSSSDYTEVKAGGRTTAAIRLQWVPGSAAPSIGEIIPWFADVPVAEISTAPAEVDATVGSPAALTVTLTATRITTMRGRLTVTAPDGVVVDPAATPVALRRGEQATVAVTASPSTVGDYPLTATFQANSGDPVQATSLVRVHPAVSEQNIALASAGATATASGTEQDLPQFTPEHAIDGDTGSRWSSGYDDASWLQVQFAEPADLGKVVLRWEASYGKAFELQTSTDGAEWTTAAAVTDGIGGVQTIWIDRSDVQYLRMQGVSRASSYGYSLYELEAYPRA